MRLVEARYSAPRSLEAVRRSIGSSQKPVGESRSRRADLIKAVVADASDQVQAKARIGSDEFAQARSLVG